MKTTRECLTCFAKQAHYTIQLTTDDEAVHQDIFQKVIAHINSFDFNISPPENAVSFYNLIYKLSGCEDPFLPLKEQSTDFALRLRPYVKKQIITSKAPLWAAIKFSMAGNIIDYGAHHDFDPEKVLLDCLSSEPKINDYKALQKHLAGAEQILFLADNCGEIVFDGLLIEQLGANKNITISVKDKPIINDALLTDARVSEIPDGCRIFTNGTGCPGTPLSQCSTEFKRLFYDADLIISKGQGNFETLSDVVAPIFFLLTVKCDVVARHITEKANRLGTTVKNGDMVLLQNLP